jgi:hypothetical protein
VSESKGKSEKKRAAAARAAAELAKQPGAEDVPPEEDLLFNVRDTPSENDEKDQKK